LSLAL